MNRFFNATLALFLGASLVSCSKDDTTAPSDGTIRVLFIGNSLTYVNDLPTIVERVAEAAGKHIETEMLALPDYALIDHWNDGQAQQRIRSGHFDYVVLQQGPSSLPLNRDTLRLATALFAPVIRANGGVPALFAVWPEVERSSVYPVVSESYRLAAEDVDGVFLPVGDTWAATFNARGDAPLYGDDGYHPGFAGSYAAAVVMVSVFANVDPRSLPGEISGVSLTQSLMSTINTAAYSTLASHGLIRQ